MAWIQLLMVQSSSELLCTRTTRHSYSAPELIETPLHPSTHTILVHESLSSIQLMASFSTIGLPLSHDMQSQEHFVLFQHHSTLMHSGRMIFSSPVHSDQGSPLSDRQNKSVPCTQHRFGQNRKRVQAIRIDM